MDWRLPGDVSEWLVWLASGGHTLLAIVAISFVLRTRRGFSSTSGWFFMIVALPFVGSLAYFCLANPIVRRSHRKRMHAATRLREFLRGPSDDARRALASDVAIPARAVFRLAMKLTGMAPTQGNRLTLLTRNAEAFQRIEAAIQSAKRVVWAEYYIIQDDATGRRFLDLLTERAREGLEVKLLYDAVGSSGLDGDRLAALRFAGGETAEFHPVNPLRRRWAVHLRNHRKIVVVDGETGFIGGMNIGDEYSGRSSWRRARPWRDTHLEVHGPAVADLAEIFIEDWFFATDRLPELPPTVEASARVTHPGGTIVAAIPSGPDQEQNATGLVYFAGIASAMHRCYITSPYFIPDDPTLQAMCCAALRGVDIRLIVPRINDSMLLGMAMRSYYPPLIRSGVRVYEYLPRMLHSKTMAVDGAWGLIGSANLDMRSFRLNFEASVLAYDPEFIVQLERQFTLDLARCREVTGETISKGTLLSAMSEGAAQLLSPLL